MKYAFSYRGNEIEVEVEAKDRIEAFAKLQAGNVESCEVQFWALWPEYWVPTEPMEETDDETA